MRQYCLLRATSSHTCVARVNHCVLHTQKGTMDSTQIERLARRIREHRAGKGIREAAKEIGVSAATLSRIENGNVPDLETFGRVCQWLHEDPAQYLGLKPVLRGTQSARVHFKKGAAIKQDSAKALSEMILLAHKAFFEDELEN